MNEDPTIEAKLKAEAELRDARDAFDAAEKAMHAAGLRLWGARRGSAPVGRPARRERRGRGPGAGVGRGTWEGGTVSARYCDVCRQTFEQEGNEAVCGRCRNAWAPYRAPAPQTPEPTNIDLAEEFVRDSPFGTDERTIACALARIANVLERWEARGFK